MTSRPGSAHLQGGRHTPEWYDQRGEHQVFQRGDRFFIACEGGPCTSRLEAFPPRLEIEEREGTYVLLDDGLRRDWRYMFVPHAF